MKRVGRVDVLNTHPRAFSDQSKILEKLKQSNNWIHGTEIFHDWDESTDSVTFYYDFPSSDDEEKDLAWTLEIESAISNHTLA